MIRRFFAFLGDAICDWWIDEMQHYDERNNAP